MAIKKYITQSETETIKLGHALAQKLKAGDCLALIGEFGSGKTTFVKGLASGLGFKKKNYVCSPSFVILKNYKGRLPIYHFDLYRLENLRDLENLGFTEFMGSGGVCAIEWARAAESFLPPGYLRVEFEVLGPQERSIKITRPHVVKKEKAKGR